MQLSPVPRPLDDELQQYAAFRSREFCRFRTGGQVVATTVESDRANALRWLGFVCPAYQQRPTLRLFASARVGEWTQAWVEKLRGLGLKASSLAVYTNGVISMCHYALSLEGAADVCPVEELVVRYLRPRSPRRLPSLTRARLPCPRRTCAGRRRSSPSRSGSLRRARPTGCRGRTPTALA